MENNSSASEGNEFSGHFLIQQLKEKKLKAHLLTREQRQQCVEVLLWEGYTVTTMAQLLSRSEKTIKRDVEAVLKKHALFTDSFWQKKMAGELLARARIHAAYLMRQARGKEGAVADKAKTEFLAWQVWLQAFEKFQSMGCIPCEPHVLTDVAPSAPPVIQILPVEPPAKEKNKNDEQPNSTA